MERSNQIPTAGRAGTNAPSVLTVRRPLPWLTAISPFTIERRDELIRCPDPGYYADRDRRGQGAPDFHERLSRLVESTAAQEAWEQCERSFTTAAEVRRIRRARGMLGAKTSAVPSVPSHGVSPRFGDA